MYLVENNLNLDINHFNKEINLLNQGPIMFS